MPAPCQSLSPHSGQNFALAGNSLPHWGHLRTNGAPHSIQNLPLWVFLPQAGQIISSSPNASIFVPHSRQNFAPAGTSALQFGQSVFFATVYKGNMIKNLIMDCQSYTKYRPNETTGGIFVSWRRKEELLTGA